MIKKEDQYNLNLLLQLIVVLASVLGSLFFSEIMGYVPCNLCWYQRLCVYPMLFIILTGLYLKSKEAAFFLLPFSIAGLFISVYHNLVYYKFIAIIVPCTESAPCTQQQLNWLGFVTIPMLSLLTFVVLFGLNIMAFSLIRKTKDLNEK
ncbi:MAG: disulfide bond formation protein B [Pseudobdellovibrio sp.]